MLPFEMTDEQRRIYLDTAQLHEAYMDAFFKSRSYRGGMHWKKAKGKKYLFRSLDRHGYGKSLGPSSQETEAIYDNFHKQKKQVLTKLHQLKEKLREQARFCKAARIARVPRVVTAILRLLEQHRLLGRNLQIVGTHALYAYEARAGLFLERGLLATQDMDLLWDIRPKLRLFAVADTDTSDLIDILQRADRSFDMLGKKSFRAVNQTGYMVDLIKPEPKSFLSKEKRQIGGTSDLMAAEIKNLQWLIAAPKFDQVVIGEDGFPAKMVVPDPRAFAVHKLWLSSQKNRAAIKKKRDRSQALAVCKLVLAYMPEFEFKQEVLRMFPKDVVSDGVQALGTPDLPPGYGE
ncbi:MAG: nucleotidyltransferase domain-containing protein [Desulfobacterales bacterium]|nr:nucleotidyltransferase domain-containing protein [Desulfobacterales bacterium]MCF8079960.1 nucleotidyltransferase domain-containing protein [Desulfobacterales bacterium]